MNQFFLDFWSRMVWSCRMVSPVVEQITAILFGQNKKWLNSTWMKTKEIAMKYGIQSIPSLLIFKNGKEIKRTIGAAPKDTYVKFINEDNFFIKGNLCLLIRIDLRKH
ncbi:MAG: thioredoxin domain-containing protein [Candidatus Nitrosocosmicus sp.]|nr:thioredoxin domain-containing protein [Candidatus Nitrosocosmicus sp.]